MAVLSQNSFSSQLLTSSLHLHVSYCSWAVSMRTEYGSTVHFWIIKKMVFIVDIRFHVAYATVSGEVGTIVGVDPGLPFWGASLLVRREKTKNHSFRNVLSHGTCVTLIRRRIDKQVLRNYALLHGRHWIIILSETFQNAIGGNVGKRVSHPQDPRMTSSNCRGPCLDVTYGSWKSDQHSWRISLSSFVIDFRFPQPECAL